MGHRAQESTQHSSREPAHSSTLAPVPSAADTEVSVHIAFSRCTCPISLATQRGSDQHFICTASPWGRRAGHIPARDSPQPWPSSTLPKWQEASRGLAP